MFTFSGKATAFIGPVCAAALTFLFSQRLGFAFSIVLLLSGMLLMLKVSYKQIKNYLMKPAVEINDDATLLIILSRE